MKIDHNDSLLGRIPHDQILAFSDPTELARLGAQPASWRAGTSLTAGLIRDGIRRMFGAVGLTGVLDRIAGKISPPAVCNPLRRRPAVAAGQ